MTGNYIFIQAKLFSGDLNLKSNFLCDLKPHSKFQKPTITPSGRKVSEAEERKSEERERR